MILRNMNILKCLFGILGCLWAGIEVYSQIQLPSVFSDGMVLQRNSRVAIWGWGNPAEELLLLPGWNVKDTVRVKVDCQGCWKAELRTSAAGGPYTLEIKETRESRRIADVMLGEVWLCSGQSNMEWSADMGIKNGAEEVAQAACPSVHIFHVPKQGSAFPQDDCRGQWESCSPQSMRRTSATAYFFARFLSEQLDVPVGILVSAWGGTPAEVWTPAEVVEADSVLSRNVLKEYPWWPVAPGVLYNRMIHPLVPYGLAGCIWYQGESNHENASSYGRLMTQMIGAWRERFRQPLPFYYVQIAPHTYHSAHNTPALLREQQQSVLETVSRTGMINISDLVEDVKDIHPRNKRAIGERLGCMVLDKEYERFVAPYESPRLAEASLQGRQLVLRFEGRFNRLVSSTRHIVGLSVTEGGRTSVAVKAKLEGRNLIIPVKGFKWPVQVSYCFDDATLGSLRTEDGLPVLPFRTEPIGPR